MAKRVASPVFVGRQDELDRLTAALDEAAGGRFRVVLVGGEAGIGKSRLVTEFSARASATGARVLDGACVPLGESSVPYGPIVEALRRFIRSAERGERDGVLGPAMGELGRLLPELAETPDPGLRSAPAWARGRFFEALIGVLERLAARAPLLLAVEDLHWADRATLDLLAFLVRNLRDERLLLLGSYRTDDVHRPQPVAAFLAELERLERAERVELVPFDRAEVGRQVAAILGREPDPTIVATIHARTGGNPFFVEELLALGDPTISLPASLREVLLARVEALAEPTRALLQAASVAGSHVDAPTLARARGVPPDALTPMFRDAVAHGILVPLGGTAERFAFHHELLREAIYDDLLPGERARLHARIAEALEASSNGRDPALAAGLAHHWMMAGELPRALAASVQAGLAATQSFAPADAQAQFEHAIELWPWVPDAAGLTSLDRPGLMRLAGEAAGAAGAYDRAAAQLRAAVRTVDAEAEPIRAGLLYDQLGYLALLAGGDAESLAAHREAVRLVPAEPPTAARARVLAGYARRLMLDRLAGEGAEMAARAIEIARAVEARDIEADALATLGPAQAQPGDADVAAATLQRARDLALSTGDVPATARAWNNLASILEGEDCVREALAAAAWEDAHGLERSTAPLTRFIAAFALYQLGRWEEAREVVAQAERGRPEGGAAVLLEIGHAQLEIGRGEFERAAHRLDRIDPSAGRGVRLDAELLAAHALASLRLASGELAGARAAADAVLTRWGDLTLRDRSFHCTILATALGIEADLASLSRRRRGSSGLAAALQSGRATLARAETLARELAGHHATRWRRHRAVLALCQAESARLEQAASERLWCDAAAACLAAGQLSLRPYALLREAEAILADGGRRQEAPPILQEAHRAASEMGAAPLVAQIGSLARRARIDVGRTAEADRPGEVGLGGEPGGTSDLGLAAAEPGGARNPVFFSLTPREREVLGLLAAGRTNRQIAQSLFIAPRTAGVHVSNVLGKLGVTSRTEAATLAVRLGCVEGAAGRVDPGEQQRWVRVAKNREER